MRPYKTRWCTLVGSQLSFFAKPSSTTPMTVVDLSPITDPLFVCYKSPPKKLTGGRRASVAGSAHCEFDSGRRASTIQLMRPSPSPRSASNSPNSSSSSFSSSSSSSYAPPSSPSSPSSLSALPPPSPAPSPGATLGFYFEIRHPSGPVLLQATSAEMRAAWTAALRAAISGQALSQTQLQTLIANPDSTLNCERSLSELSLSSGSRRHSVGAPCDALPFQAIVRQYSGVQLALTDSDSDQTTTTNIELAVASLSPRASSPPGPSSPPQQYARRKIRPTTVLSSHAADQQQQPPPPPISLSFSLSTARPRTAEPVDAMPSSFKVSGSPSFSGVTIPPNDSCIILSSSQVPSLSNLESITYRRRY